MFEFFTKLFTRGIENPSVPLSSSKAWEYLVSSPSSSGVAVNNNSVLGSAGVWRAVNLISSSIGRLPCHVYKRLPDGGRQRARKHPAFYLLNRGPAEHLTPFIFFQTMMSHALLHGNGYAYIFRNDLDATPESFLILDPQQTTPAKENGRLLYLTRIGNEDRKLLAENVLHFKGLGYDGFAGYPVIDVLKDTFGHGLALLRYGNVFFKNNGSPNVVIELPGFFKDEEAIQRFRQSWGSIHAGLDNAHKVAILENGAKLSKFTVNNEEAQWLASREFDLKALANVFGLPPHKLGANISTSYGSLEQENRSFLNDSLGGWLAMIEQELEAKLLTEAEKRADSHFIEFLRAALEQADLLTETNALVLQVNNGLLSLDEARQILNRPLLPDGLGQAHRIPLNLGELGKEPEPPQPQQPPEAPQPQTEQGQEPEQDQAQERLAALTESVLQRLVARMAKDVASKGARGLADRHRGVIVESLAAYPQAEAFAEKWLEELATELEAVLPEQAADVFGRIKITELTKRLA